MYEGQPDLLTLELAEALRDCFQRTVHVGLYDQVQRRCLTFLDLLEDVLQAGTAGQGVGIPADVGLTAPVAPLVGYPAGDLLVGSDHEAFASVGHIGQAQDLNGRGRAGLFDLTTLIVDEGTYPTPRRTGHQWVTHLESASLDQHSGHRATPSVQERLKHHSLRPTIGIGSEVLDLGDHVQIVQQVFNT